MYITIGLLMLGLVSVNVANADQLWTTPFSNTWSSGSWNSAAITARGRFRSVNATHILQGAAHYREVARSFTVQVQRSTNGGPWTNISGQSWTWIATNGGSQTNNRAVNLGAGEYRLTFSTSGGSGERINITGGKVWNN